MIDEIQTFKLKVGTSNLIRSPYRCLFLIKTCSNTFRFEQTDFFSHTNNFNFKYSFFFRYREPCITANSVIQEVVK